MYVTSLICGGVPGTVAVMLAVVVTGALVVPVEFVTVSVTVKVPVVA
jgi:hypothetical protein